MNWSHETTIQRGLKSFIEVGNALTAIAEKKLYREKYGTFEEYCQVRWGITRQYGNRLMTAAAAVNAMETIVSITPTAETQVRPLTSLPPEAQPRAWQAAVDIAGGEVPTAAQMQRVADEYKRERLAISGGYTVYSTVTYKTRLHRHALNKRRDAKRHTNTCRLYRVRSRRFRLAAALVRWSAVRAA